jgi:hypothetical protein
MCVAGIASFRPDDVCKITDMSPFNAIFIKQFVVVSKKQLLPIL